MIRVLVTLAVVAALAWGAHWFASHPGAVSFDWLGYRIETSVFVALVALLAVALVFSVLWSLVAFILRLPSLMSIASRARRRNKGYNALSRGMIAVGAGDERAARRYAADAARLMSDEPLALLLKAQTAQLAGDRPGAEAVFGEMAREPSTRLLGLRGLHVEARRRGDSEAAQHFAEEAAKLSPVGWASQSILDHRAGQGDWQGALDALERHAAAKHLDRKTAERRRAVLKTAIALERAEQSPDVALGFAREAAKAAPDLVPAVALAARLHGRRGDLRKAAKLIESAWRDQTHPELAEAYLNLRPGDSGLDRLARAKTLARLRPADPESRLVVARAAIDAQEFDAAREALAPLVSAGLRPSVRVCLAMAELEDSSGGGAGRVREWLTRASRAPRDAAWIADGIISDVWAPVSPVTGEIDAFVWKVPDERLAAPMEVIPAAPDPAPEPAPILELSAPDPEPEPTPDPEPAAAEPAPAEAPAEPAPAPAAEPAKSEDKPRPEPAAVAEPRAPEPPPHRVTPQPVVFPLATAPDDPGPERAPARHVF